METAPEHAAAGEPIVPVWMPNPAVPITARVLAYLFAGLMLLALLLATIVDRDPEIAPLPTRWTTYASPLGVTVPYPDGWTMEKLTRQETAPADAVQSERQSLLFRLWSDSTVNYQLQIHRFNTEVTSDAVMAITGGMDDMLQRDFTGYRPTPDATELPVHGFAFREKKTPMAGGWALLTRGDHLALLIGVCPPAGWGTMAQILAHVAQETTFE